MCEIQILSRRDTKALAPHTQHCDALQNITQNNGVSVFENMLQKWQKKAYLLRNNIVET